MTRTNTDAQQLKARADRLALTGNVVPARDLYARVVRSDRTDVEAWIKLSATERKLGRLQNAEASCRHALALRPRLALGHLELGVILQCRGRPGDAVRSYNTALALHPDLPNAHYFRGNALHEQGLLAGAVVNYRKAIVLRPEHFEALGDLGAALVELGQMAEAETFLRKALHLNPWSVAIIGSLAAIHGHAGRIDEGIALYRKALTLDPASVRATVGLASLLERAGRVVEARDILNALTTASRDPEFCLVSARLARREDRFNDALAVLRTAHPTPNRMLAGELRLMMGQLHDRSGQARQAFDDFVAGNAEVAAATGVSLDAPPAYLNDIAFARQYLSAATPSHPARLRRKDPAEATADPIFLVGFPRSGTTLLEQILDSHPSLQTMDEQPAVAAMRKAFITINNRGRVLPQDLDINDLTFLRTHYFAAANAGLVRRPGTQLVDKLPLNMVWAHLIARVFPHARFIFALRHPCDACLSCFMQHFGPNPAMQSFLSLSHTVQTYVAVMSLWQEQRRLVPLQVHQIRYEDVVGDLPGEIVKLLEFLGIAWDARVEAFAAHAAQRGHIGTPSYHQVTRPLYRTAVARWEGYAAQFAPFMQDLKPYIAAFGYETQA